MRQERARRAASGSLKNILDNDEKNTGDFASDKKERWASDTLRLWEFNGSWSFKMVASTTLILERGKGIRLNAVPIAHSALTNPFKLSFDRLIWMNVSTVIQLPTQNDFRILESGRATTVLN
jgi:hypothetical protein